MNAAVIWGWVFLLCGVAMIAWDIAGSRASSAAQTKLKDAQDKLAQAEAKLSGLETSTLRTFGGLNAEQSAAMSSLADETAEAKKSVTSAKDSVMSALDTALGELAKTHSKLVVGAFLIVLAAGAFGAPIPLVN